MSCPLAWAPCSADTPEENNCCSIKDSTSSLGCKWLEVGRVALDKASNDDEHHQHHVHNGDYLWAQGQEQCALSTSLRQHSNSPSAG